MPHRLPHDPLILVVRLDKAQGKMFLAVDRRAEMYLNASEQLRSKRVVAYFGNEDVRTLKKKLDVTDLIVDSKNIKVIPKDVIKSRIGYSPDEADSFVLAI